MIHTSLKQLFISFVLLGLAGMLQTAVVEAGVIPPGGSTAGSCLKDISNTTQASNCQAFYNTCMQQSGPGYSSITCTNSAEQYVENLQSYQQQSNIAQSDACSGTIVSPDCPSPETLNELKTSIESDYMFLVPYDKTNYSNVPPSTPPAPSSVSSGGTSGSGTGTGTLQCGPGYGPDSTGTACIPGAQSNNPSPAQGSVQTSCSYRDSFGNFVAMQDVSGDISACSSTYQGGFLRENTSLTYDCPSGQSISNLGNTCKLSNNNEIPTQTTWVQCQNNNGSVSQFQQNPCTNGAVPVLQTSCANGINPNIVGPNATAGCSQTAIPTTNAAWYSCNPSADSGPSAQIWFQGSSGSAACNGRGPYSGDSISCLSGVDPNITGGSSCNSLSSSNGGNSSSAGTDSSNPPPVATLTPTPSAGGNDPGLVCNGGTCTYQLLEPLPGGITSIGSQNGSDFLAYLNGLILLLIIMGSMLAVARFSIGGFMLMTSDVAGTQARAKSMMWASV